MKAGNFILGERARTILERELARRGGTARRLIILRYMPSFTNADGTTVTGFSPGYTVDFETQLPPGQHWIHAEAGGHEFWFMPREQWHPGLTYFVDQASGYTLSILPVRA